MYSPQVLDHFEHPRHAGDLDAATAQVKVTNPVCGDVLQLAARIEEGAVAEVRFKCKGCVPAMACGSLLAEQMQGKRIGDLRVLTEEKILTAIGGLPPASHHAAQLALDSLRALLKKVE